MTRRANARKILPGILRLTRSFWPQIARQKPLLLLSFFAVLANIAFEVLEPWPVKFIYDHIFLKSGHHISKVPFHITGDTRVVLPLLALSIVVITGLGALADYFSAVFLTLGASRILAEVRANLFVHLANLPLSFHSRHKSGDLITRITYDIDRMREVVITAVLPLVTNGLAFFAMVGVMFWINWRMALITVIPVPIFFFSVSRITRRIRDTAGLQRSREGVIAATTSETMSAIKTVQALSLQNAFSAIFSVANTRSLQEGAKAQQLSAGLGRTVEVLVASTTALVLWSGARLVVDKSLTPGDLIIFVNYLRTAFKPLRQLAKFFAQIARALASGDRILDLMHTTSDIRDSEDSFDPGALKGSIRFENVSFGYEPGRLCLHDVSLDIQPGQRVAVVGPSGSGKSTLANLLLRFYDPVAGNVLIDGKDIRNYKLESLRSQVSIVLQDSVLFAVSARQNIRFGSPKAKEQDIFSAARLANAHEFITGLPQGYDTILGERGASLSGGQRQRIAIARAALRGAPIVILDEPTTGLDGQNESEVMAALERLTEGRTTLLISHNLRAVKQADLIIYLDYGRILERGTHQELMALGGEYATTYVLQSAEGADDENSYVART